jgi:hypothetical protein
VPDVMYVPVLKARQGELTALGLIQPVTRQHVLPLLQIEPGTLDEEYGRPDVRKAIDKAVTRLGPWVGQRLLLDVGLLATEVALRDGSGAIGYAVSEVLDKGPRPTPVLRLDDGQLARRDAAAAHADLRTGVAIRLSDADMDEDYEDIDEALTSILRELALDRFDVDLVLDLGCVIGDLAVRTFSRLAVDLLRGLSFADEWRQVIVTAGAFPADLGEIVPWEIGELPRYDAALYDRVQERRRLPREPIFGDYAVTNPVATNQGYRSAPNLRYAVADRWLFLKGRLNDPRGHDQFYEVCERIAVHPDFVGAALGVADARIANPRANGRGPGNASTWRSIGTAHHLDYVVQRLTTLGEP